MSIVEYRAMSESELNAELISLCKERFNLTMQKATGQLNKAHLVKNVRRNIARIKTLQTKKAV